MAVAVAVGGTTGVLVGDAVAVGGMAGVLVGDGVTVGDAGVLVGVAVDATNWFRVAGPKTLGNCQELSLVAVQASLPSRSPPSSSSMTCTSSPKA